jgi:hypothetical protein
MKQDLEMKRSLRPSGEENMKKDKNNLEVI